MTNKKKTSSKKSTVKTASSPNDVEGPDFSPSTPEKGPVAYTRAQLIGVVFFALGASRFIEWQKALSQMTGPNGEYGNGTATICQDYIRTTDEVDHDSVCDSPVTHTMMSIKYDLSLQMVFTVVFLMIQCWSNEILMNRLNAFLTMTPVSTTLLLLQACTPFIQPRRSQLLTLSTGILMFLSLPSTGNVMREFRENRHKAPSTGLFVSLACSSMTAMHLYETWQWWETSTRKHVSHTVLALTTLSDWNEAWKVFLYTLAMDKLTMAALLVCVWTCLDDGRQRRFLLVWAVIKFYEYTAVLSSYDDSKFADLELMKNMALACTVVSGIGWIAPTIHLFGNKPAGPKAKTV